MRCAATVYSFVNAVAVASREKTLKERRDALSANLVAMSGIEDVVGVQNLATRVAAKLNLFRMFAMLAVCLVDPTLRFDLLPAGYVPEKDSPTPVDGVVWAPIDVVAKKISSFLRGHKSKGPAASASEKEKARKHRTSLFKQVLVGHALLHVAAFSITHEPLDTTPVIPATVLATNASCEDALSVLLASLAAGARPRATGKPTFLDNLCRELVKPELHQSAVDAILTVNELDTQVFVGTRVVAGECIMLADKDGGLAGASAAVVNHLLLIGGFPVPVSVKLAAKAREAAQRPSKPASKRISLGMCIHWRMLHLACGVLRVP